MSARSAAERHPSSLGGGARRRARPLALATVVVAVGLLAALFAFGLGRNPDVVQPVLVGRAAPAFTLARVGGGAPVSLSSLRGQVVVVNFWASWCTDCRVEQPALASLWSSFRDRGVVLLGVSFQDPASSALEYLRSSGSSWPSLADPGSRTALAYGVTGVPETFVVAPDGRIAAKFIGPVSYGQVADTVTRLLPGGA